MRRNSRLSVVLLGVCLMMALGAPQALAAPPAAPTGLDTNGRGLTAVALVWVDNASDELSYQVFRRPEGGAEIALPLLPADTNYYLDTGLVPGTRYYYTVYATNSDGSSCSSPPFEIVTAPAGAPFAPTGMHLISSSSSSVSLSWYDGANNETNYFVERMQVSDGSISALSDLGPDVTAYTDSSVVPGAAYRYRAIASNSFGRTESNWIDVIVPAASTPATLAAPDNLHLVSATSAQVDLAWNDNATGETVYYVDRSELGGTFAGIATLGANASSYADTSVIPGTSYIYQVYCGDGTSISAFSNSIQVDVPAGMTTPPTGAPAAPTNLLVTGISAGGIDLIWTDNSTNETGFIIERWGPADTGFVFYDSLPAETVIYHDSGFGVPFQTGATYSYRVTAINTIGYSDISNAVSATIPVSGTSVLSFYIGSSTYYVNGAATSMDVAPIAYENRTLLPVRYVVEPLGGTALWDAIEQKATVYFNSHTVELWVGSNTARVDGVNTLIDPANPNVMPMVEPPGRIMMPLRFIAESTGCTVNWIPATSEARVTFTP